MHAFRPTRSAHDRERWWLDRRGRVCAGVGVVLVVSGLAHLAVWAVLGGPWEGPVTWRKPILFGISGGLTAISLGWAWSKLPGRVGDAWLAAATAWALVIEVALIDLQRWRGVASHFNRQTPLDAWLYDVMGGLILFVTLVIVDLTARFFWQRVDLSSDMRLAVRAGLFFLTISCLLGIWASVHGDMRAAVGLPPETYGAAGVTKFPHGAALHAIQWLPMLAWAGRRAGLSEPVRWRLVAIATLGTSLLLGYALMQTLAGRGRFDSPPVAAVVVALAAVCLVGPAIVTAVAWGSSHRRSPPAGA